MKEERVITLRPLNMEDFRVSETQVKLSISDKCSGGSVTLLTQM